MNKLGLWLCLLITPLLLQGPCLTGERIVADRETKTRCITYKDSKGAACPPIAVFFAYKGRCRFLGDECGACGRRLVVDAFGQVGRAGMSS